VIPLYSYHVSSANTNDIETKQRNLGVAIGTANMKIKTTAFPSFSSQSYVMVAGSTLRLYLRAEGTCGTVIVDQMRLEVFTPVKMSMLVFRADYGNCLRSIGIFLQVHTALRPRRPTLTDIILIVCGCTDR
jgi:hypothetical protein